MSAIMNKEDSPENALLWTREEEELLKEWCDIANCFRWLHEQASFKNREINNKIALPVIVLSTLTGTANFAMGSLVAEQYKAYASAIIGGINIFCGILTTLQTYFKYAENTEAHASASKLWSKFQRTIQIELAIEPAKRKHPNEFLKYCIDEYNKLVETSPTIPTDIASDFENKFNNVTNVFKPDIYDKLTSTQTYMNYLSRTSKLVEDKDKSNELKSIHIDNDGFTEAKPYEITRPRNSFIKNKVETINTIVEKGVDPKNVKESVKKELESIRPNIKKLISQIETLKTPYIQATDSPINSIDIVDDSKEPKENDTKIINVDIDSVKNL